MKLKRVSVDGFRGAAVAVELPLGESSVCLLAENGHGKTTWVDALELWSTGDVRHYHREGYGLDCMVHVDCAAATISAEPTGLPLLSRTLVAGSPSPLTPSRPVPAGTVVPPLPILRHRTMADFMAMSPGEKRKALLELLGLARLTDFRQAIKTACTTAERILDEARRNAATESDALGSLLDGRDLVAVADELRQRAGLQTQIRTEADLTALEIESTPTGPVTDRVSRVGDLVRAIGAVTDGPRDDWNALTSDQALAAATGLSALMTAGVRALEGWSEETCPLCRQSKDRTELADELTSRAAELRELEVRFEDVGRRVDDHIAGLEALVRALDEVIRAAPLGGWPQQVKLGLASEQIRAEITVLRTARLNRTPLPDQPAWSIPPVAMLEGAAATDASAAAPASSLAQLVRLRDQFVRRGGSDHALRAAESVCASVTAFLGVADASVRDEVERTIASVGKLTADYYGRLVMNPIYSEVKLDYTTGRAGGIEFSLLYDGRHRVTPPQRVMSES